MESSRGIHDSDSKCGIIQKDEALGLDGDPVNVVAKDSVVNVEHVDVIELAVDGNILECLVVKCCPIHVLAELHINVDSVIGGVRVVHGHIQRHTPHCTFEALPCDVICKIKSGTGTSTSIIV